MSIPDPKNTGRNPADRNNGLSDGRRLSVKQITWIAVAVLAVILILQNGGKTQIQLLFWGVEFPLWLLLVACVGLGFVLGWLWPKLRRDRHDRRD